MYTRYQKSENKVNVTLQFTLHQWPTVDMFKLWYISKDREATRAAPEVLLADSSGTSSNCPTPESPLLRGPIPA